ncbi:hypothetical protein DYB28_009453 [Aphanomyces astaci]|uniref:Uncharacterized protein n=1 Tax=Aphanomyces astaci TaxID=112090 RepID=A0A9X8H3H0_APHAT|nr:hypothetical protein DYB28_009453 [Aphanomyces astaci]
MSYRLIEARFQMLDEAVARLDKSKHTKLNASVGLRGSVRINPHDVATWIRPSHPRSSTSIAPPSSSTSSDSSSPATLISATGPSFNQSTHDVHLTLRRSTLLSRQAKPDVHPLIVHRAPASHDWGHPHDEYDDDDDGCLAPVDPKEAKVHRVAHDTWECNASNCIVFDKDPPIPSTWPSSSKKKHAKTTATEPILRSTIFDPTRYFDHVRQPIDVRYHA